MIEGDSDRLVADFSKDRHNVLEGVMCEAVGVIADSHGQSDLRSHFPELCELCASARLVLESMLSYGHTSEDRRVTALLVNVIPGANCPMLSTPSGPG